MALMSVSALSEQERNLIAIIDLDLGNLHSVARAISHCGGKVMITDDIAEIQKAGKLVLPGVGSFKAGMNSLKNKGLVEVIQNRASAGTPLLGICLGMQLLMDHSEEQGSHHGLGLIAGQVKKFQNLGGFDGSVKVPHINWCAVRKKVDTDSWADSILCGVEPGADHYFVHSLCVVPGDQQHTLAISEYGNSEFCSVIKRDNIVGCQFHPEKSGDVGLQIIENFISAR